MFKPDAPDFTPAGTGLNLEAQEFTPISLPTADAATYVGEDSEPAENKEDLALADSNMVAGIYYQPPVLAGPHPQTVLDENGFIVPHPDPYALEPGPLPPLNLHLYRLPPFKHSLASNRRTMHSFAISDELREELTRRNHVILQLPDASKTLPEVHKYHSLYPLDSSDSQNLVNTSKLLNYSTRSYKAICSADGHPYFLLRLENFRLNHETAFSILDPWLLLNHQNVVKLHEAFTTKAFNDDSLVFVYSFQAGSNTISSRFLDNGDMEKISEPLLWSLIVQIALGLRAIHSIGLGHGNLNPNRIIINSFNRVKINGAGMMDLLTFGTQPGSNAPRFQQEDLLSFGQLVLCLACRTTVALQDIPRSMEYITHAYSLEIKNVIVYLMSKPTPLKTIDQMFPALMPHITAELDYSFRHIDSLESELCKELENARIVRLIAKLGFINERPEFGMDPHWSETGDRYLLKLFRDYVFHQVDSHGHPVVDMAHVISCLNKLDAGSAERILLTSRDEQSCLVVSYRDLKRCVDTAFLELIKPTTK